MNLRIVAGREYVSPSCGEGYVLFAHRGAFAGGSIDPMRLKGKRFSVRARGITEFILDSFLKAHGMKLDDVQRVDLPLSESLAALAGNKVDAMFDIEASRSPLAMSPDIVKVWRYSSIQPFHQYSYIVLGDSMLREGLSPGSRFLAAYLKAAGEFMDGRTPRFLRDFAAKHNLDVDRTVAECRDTFPRDGAIDLPSLQRNLDWQVEKGYATKALGLNQLIDLRYLDEARALLASGRWHVSHSGAGGVG
jgi:ABC-type nitrate/sulfonate/bicarbonate transport system substrate-binding protein